MDRYNSIMIIGPSGSGKTTQGEELQKRGMTYHLSMGQLRRSLGDNHPLVISYSNHKKSQDYDLATSALFKMFEEGISHAMRSGQYDPNQLLSIDGLVRYPDQMGQADAKLNLLCVIELYLSNDKALQRVRSRAQSGERPESSEDGLLLHKYRIYRTQTAKVIKTYKQRGLLEVISAAGPIDVVHHDIKKALARRQLLR